MMKQKLTATAARMKAITGKKIPAFLMKKGSAMKVTAAQKKKLNSGLVAAIKKSEGEVMKMKKEAMKLKKNSSMMMKKAAMKMKKVSAMKIKMKDAAMKMKKAAMKMGHKKK
jgi:alanyl-tRNA synthetase